VNPFDICLSRRSLEIQFSFQYIHLCEYIDRYESIYIYLCMNTRHVPFVTWFEGAIVFPMHIFTRIYIHIYV